MPVCRMDEERMAQVNVARASSRVRQWSLVNFGRQHNLLRRVSLFAGRGEHPGDFQMRADTNPGGRVLRARVAEQEQHQQCASFRPQIRAPASIYAKASVDMPAIVARIALHGKRYGDSPCQVWVRDPAARSHKLIEGSIQSRRVGRPAERLSVLPSQPNYGPCPTRRIVGFDIKLVPEQFPAFIGQTTRERL